MNEGTIERLNESLDGRYVVEREIGEGGMATVFLAKDIKHNRNVALKVLKPELAAVVGAERFLTEIETTANLQHPHILPLFDSGEADSFLFYVMPFVEGDTLADRISREKQLPVDEALGIATSVAGALHVAHQAGIIHRDIKPGNILLSQGQPLVADFGIALAVGAGGARMTETGLSVGTPYYMSPEQATGDQMVGPSADIYAVACVLFEMLVGEPPYLGNTAQAVLGKIIQGLPVSATAARKSVPLNVDAALRKALEKLPADRFTSAEDFVKALSDPNFRHGSTEQTVATEDAKRWKGIALVASVAAVIAVGAGLSGAFGSDGGNAPVLRQKIEIPDAGPSVRWGLGMALAPDGSGMVYMDRVTSDQRPQLFYKARDEAEGTPLPNTQDVNGVVFSPDGQLVAFLQNGNLITRPIRGGAATTLASGADTGVPGLDWLSDGTILYEIADGDQLGRIPSDGSAPTDTIFRPGSMRWAHGIEGHESALTLRCPGCDLGIVDFASGEVSYVLEDIARAWYVPTGHIVYVRTDGAVYATPYDPETQEMNAVGTPLFEGVRTGNGWADMVVGDDGTMIYIDGGQTGSLGNTETLVWVDREGDYSPVDPAWPAQNLSPAVLSPDGSKVAVTVSEGEAADIVVHELPGGPRSRLTAANGRYFDPVWSRDGRFLIFADLSGNQATLLRLRADGSAPAPDTLLRMPADFGSLQLTPAGEGLVYTVYGQTDGTPDIHYFEIGADSTVPLLATAFAELAPTVSPDGRWMAYTSDATGEMEVFVRPFPDVLEGRTQVSNGGGIEPRWSRDGSELFYRNEDDFIVATFRRDSAFVVESRTPLFRLGEDYIVRVQGRSYDVDLNGDRFLMVRNSEAADADGEAATMSMILVQNWFAELRVRLGGGN